MGELTIESLLAYQTMTADPRVDEIFLRLARFLRDVGSAYVTANQSDDTFLAPALPFPGRLDQVRRLVPLYGAALDANRTRARYGSSGDNEHCTDATALTAVALRALVRRGTYDGGGPVGPFPSEGAALLQLHHEFAFCAQVTFNRWFPPYRDPATWTSARIGLGAASPEAFDVRIGGVYQPNLIVKRISANRRILCAAPAYLERHGTPSELSDLDTNQCIVNREAGSSDGHMAFNGPRRFGDR